jgi:hypothetical protein
MTKKTPTSNPHKPSLTKKLAVGGTAVAVLAIGISLALGKGAFQSSSAATAAPDAPKAQVVSTVATSALPTASASTEPGVGIKALEKATADDKYFFAFFSANKPDQSAAMKKVFDEAMGKVAERVVTAEINITNPAERDIVNKFELDRAPMPLVLAVAPNGAIMGGFPTKFEVNDLLGAFGSPCTERCMKSLQDGKLVLLCVQNSTTTSNAEALQGVNDFKADEKYSTATEIVMLDPTDAAETAFLSDLKIDPKTTVATTAFLAPPGSVITEVVGPTTKDELAQALQQANTSCGPGGCGPGGCAPK